MAYPLDPNAPFSPKAIEAAKSASAASTSVAETAAIPSAPVPAGGLNLSDPSIIRSAQAALAAKGGYTGPQSGAVDAEFLNALTKYQGANGLPMGGLNEPTLKALGVIE